MQNNLVLEYNDINDKQLIIIGGEHHKTAHGTNFNQHYTNLKNFALETYTVENILYRWSTQDCMTLDGLPYIGHYSSNTPNLYIATGFQKWGMTNSTVASMILRDLGVELQKKYFSYLGLFNATTLEIPEKEDSVLPKQWDELTRYTLSFGYGIAVSQATEANALISLFNGGYYVPLTLIKHKPSDNLDKVRVFSEQTSALMRGMGRLVVAKGTGKSANIKGYNVGGKTATAELPDPATGKYDRNKVLASVVAYLPAENPKFLILLSRSTYLSVTFMSLGQLHGLILFKYHVTCTTS